MILNQVLRYSAKVDYFWTSVPNASGVLRRTRYSEAELRGAMLCGLKSYSIQLPKSIYIIYR